MTPSMNQTASPATQAQLDRYVVVGNPVRHSQSPAIHAAFASATGQPLHYGRLESTLDGFGPALRAFAASQEGPAGERGPARGCNVTVPFKFEALAMASQCSDRARLAGAANVLRFDAAGWFADNTDGNGLVRDIQVNAGRGLAGQRVLMLGAGGAAAGALGPLLQARPAELWVVNRTVDRATDLVDRHRAWARAHGVTLRAGAIADANAAFDVVINASASSLQGVDVPLSGAVLRPDTLALDMMYGPAAAPFLAWADHHGAVGRDGLGMLVEQAAESFALWRGVRPDTAAVLRGLRERLAAG